MWQALERLHQEVLEIVGGENGDVREQSRAIPTAQTRAGHVNCAWPVQNVFGGNTAQ